MQAAVSAETSDKSTSRNIVATLAFTGIVVALQQTLVLPLLPAIPEFLGTTHDNASWVVTSTLLFGAVAMPTVTRLADMYGKKRMLMATLAVMTLGSGIGALSSSLPLILVARSMQGVGLALIPVGIAIMRDELPRDRVPLGVALMSASLAIGTGAGLPLAGLISSHLDWHAIFWVTGLVGFVLLVAVWRVVKESPVRTGGIFDYRGAIIGSIALAAIMLALSKGAHWGWTSPTTIGLAIGGTVLVLGWIPLELRARNPLVNIRVASRPAILMMNAASFLLGLATFANMLVTPQLLQLPVESGFGLGFDVLSTGLWTAPIAIVFGLMAPVSARMISRVGPQTSLVVGAMIMSVSYVGRVYLSHELWQIVLGSMLVGVGTSITYAAFPTLIMRAVPVTESASANGLNMLMRYIGTATASAVLAALSTMTVVRVADEIYPSLQAFMQMFWIGAGASVLAAVIVTPILSSKKVADESVDASDRGPGIVVRGRVIRQSGHPIPQAVVTVLTRSGDQIDWSQVDSAGDFAIAIPGSGRYLIITAAEGWMPRSQITDLFSECEIEPIVLTERMTISGCVTDSERPVEGAVVAITRQSGQSVAAVRTSVGGRYETALPANGRYVVTALCDRIAVARAVTIWGATRIIDLELADSARISPPSTRRGEEA